MDKPIEKEFKRNKLKKRVVLSASVLLTVIVIIASINFLNRDTAHLDDLKIESVQNGSVSDMIVTTGYLRPQKQYSISSPFSSKIENIKAIEGQKLRRGDTILIFDKEPIIEEIEEREGLLQLEQNKIQKIILQLNEIRHKLNSEDQIKSIEIQNLEAESENAEKLYEIGGGTKNTVNKIKNELKVLRIHKKESEYALKIAEKTNNLNLTEFKINLDLLKQSIENLKKQLEECTLVTNHSGVLSEMKWREGDIVSQGELLCKVSDLESFKVETNISDSYLDNIQINRDALIKIDQRFFKGRISNVIPEIENNQISFSIVLNNQDDESFKSNLKVEVFIIRGRKENVLTIPVKNGFQPNSYQEVFVLNTDGIAKKTKIKTGISDNENIEILYGLKAGDRIVYDGLNNRASNEITIVN